MLPGPAIVALNDGFFAGFGQPLGRAEAVLREDDLSDDSRSHQSPERPSVGRSEEQGATEELNGLRRHHGRIHAGEESPISPIKSSECFLRDRPL